MCNKNVPQAQMHSEFEHILQEITPDQSLLALAKKITAHAYNEKYAYIQQQKKIYKHKYKIKTN